MRHTTRLLALACVIVFLLAAAAASHAATNATDPAGDNCMTGVNLEACGIDFVSASDSVDSAGNVRLKVAFTGTHCVSQFPAVVTQPAFHLFPASSAEAQQASSLGMAWAASSTTNYVWSKAGSTGSDDEIQLTELLAPGSVEVEIPASIIAGLGGLPLKWFVTNSCRSHPSDPLYSDGDRAPDTGLYTLEQPDACPNLAGAQAGVPAGMFIDAAGNCIADACPNIEGGQAGVPSGMFTDGGGNCITDACPNLAGGQASVPAGFVLGAGGTCTQLRFTGTAGANTIFANALANVINALGGNDKVYGRAGNDTLAGGAGNDRLFGEAGTDTVRGGPGKDTVTGGAGRDRLFGDAGNDVLDGRDRARGDTINGGAGVDTCYYNAGDRLIGCERKVKV